MEKSYRFVLVLVVSVVVVALSAYGYLTSDKKQRKAFDRLQETVDVSTGQINPRVEDWGSPPDKDDPSKYVVKSRLISQGVIEVDFDESLLLTAIEADAENRRHPELNCIKPGCPGVVERR